MYACQFFPFPQMHCPPRPTCSPHYLLTVHPQWGDIHPIKIQHLGKPVEYTKIIRDTIETFQQHQVLPKNTCGNLKTTIVRTQHFHITSKIHIYKIYQEGHV